MRGVWYHGLSILEVLTSCGLGVGDGAVGSIFGTDNGDDTRAVEIRWCCGVDV